MTLYTKQPLLCMICGTPYETDFACVGGYGRAPGCCSKPRFDELGLRQARAAMGKPAVMPTRQIPHVHSMIDDNNKRWFRLIETILGFHPVSDTDALDRGIKRVTDLKNWIGQLEVQLAGCGTAAFGYNKEPAKKGDYGWSPAYQNVLDLLCKLEAAEEKLKLVEAAIAKR